MTAEQALLQAILEDPEDAPRLVYADWLEEHDNPERAEFIRVQCELARHGVAPSRRKRLRARAQELLEAHRGQWLGRLRRSPLPWVFHRGFAERLGEGGVFRSKPGRWKDETYCDYVRFFPDGRLLCDCLSPPPSSLRAVERHLQRRNPNVRRGPYTLHSAASRVTVRFELAVRVQEVRGVLSYEGVIQGTVLRLKGHYNPHGQPFREHYRWVELTDFDLSVRVGSSARTDQSASFFPGRS